MATCRLAIAFLLVAASLCGCKRHPQAPGGFALAFVEAGRSGALGADWVDDALIERMRRAERLELAAHAGVPADALVKVWARPADAAFAQQARADKQRERAAAGLARSLQGECQAVLDEEGRAKRVAAITSAVENAPAEASAELTALAAALGTAQLARVQCTHGAVGLLLVPHPPDWRVVDVFAMSENRSPVPLPSVK